MKVIDSLNDIPEYTTGDDYEVGDIITQRGNFFKVSAAITTAPEYADYSKMNCISCGYGNAFHKNWNTSTSPSWLHICDIPIYWAGNLNIGGLYNGKQATLTGHIQATWSRAAMFIRVSQHSVGCFNSVKLMQTANGQPWQLWISVDETTSDFQMHFMSNGAGNAQMTIPSTSQSVTGTPAWSKDYEAMSWPSVVSAVQFEAT